MTGRWVGPAGKPRELRLAGRLGDSDDSCDTVILSPTARAVRNVRNVMYLHQEGEEEEEEEEEEDDGEEIEQEHEGKKVVVSAGVWGWDPCGREGGTWGGGAGLLSGEAGFRPLDALSWSPPASPSVSPAVVGVGRDGVQACVAPASCRACCPSHCPPPPLGFLHSEWQDHWEEGCCCTFWGLLPHHRDAELWGKSQSGSAPAEWLGLLPGPAPPLCPLPLQNQVPSS